MIPREALGRSTPAPLPFAPALRLSFETKPNYNPNTNQDGSPATLPHWAKWAESYVADADAKLKAAYADRLPLLTALSKEWDPNGVFVNAFFRKLLF